MKLTLKTTLIETYELDSLEDMGVSNTFAAGLMRGAEILRQIREGEINPDESDIGEIEIIGAELTEGDADNFEDEYQEEQEEIVLEDEPDTAPGAYSDPGAE